jgi:hypothetical protein
MFSSVVERLSIGRNLESIGSRNTSISKNERYTILCDILNNMVLSPKLANLTCDLWNTYTDVYDTVRLRVKVDGVHSWMLYYEALDHMSDDDKEKISTELSTTLETKLEKQKDDNQWRRRWK